MTPPSSAFTSQRDPCSLIKLKRDPSQGVDPSIFVVPLLLCHSKHKHFLSSFLPPTHPSSIPLTLLDLTLSSLGSSPYSTSDEMKLLTPLILLTALSVTHAAPTRSRTQGSLPRLGGVNLAVSRPNPLLPCSRHIGSGLKLNPFYQGCELGMTTNGTSGTSPLLWLEARSHRCRYSAMSEYRPDRGVRRGWGESVSRKNQAGFDK